MGWGHIGGWADVPAAWWGEYRDLRPTVHNYACKLTFRDKPVTAEVSLGRTGSVKKHREKERRPRPPFRIEAVWARQAAFRLTWDSASLVRSASVLFSSSRFCSKSFAASSIPSCRAQVRSVP